MAKLTSRRGFLAEIAGASVVSALARDFSAEAAAQPVGTGGDAALTELADRLSESRRGHMIRPGMPGHRRIRSYNGRFDCLTRTTYLKPSNTEGVQDIVRWANKHKRTLAVRGGGHSFEGKSSHPDLVIDMSQMTDMDLTDGVLKVQAGVLLGDVYKRLTAADRVLPGGTCPTVGLVGHTLGGGIGDFLPMFGYAAQSLTSARMVTMGGALLSVSETDLECENKSLIGDLSGPQLMKLLRGGGQGSFGVVTDMTFAAHHVGDAKLASFRLDARPSLSAAQAATLIQAWQSWRMGLKASLPDHVSAKLNLSRNGSTYSIEISGLAVIPDSANITMGALREALNPLFQRPEIASKRFNGNISLSAAIRSFLDTDETTRNPKRRMLYGSSSALPGALPPPAVQHLMQAMTPAVFVSLYTSGGVSNRGRATALHPSEFLVEWSIYSPRRDNDAARLLRTLNAEVLKRAGFDDLAFPNYPDADARNYSPQTAEIERLSAVFDPNGISTSSLYGRRTAGWLERACR